MAITIVATVGSATANSYVTEVEQIAYMATHLNASTWTSITGSTCTETEKAAMVEATRELTALAWQGTRTDETQVLSWPRAWASNPDSPNFAYNYYLSTVVPQRVKDATMELAFQFIKAGTTDIAALDPNLGVINKTVDVLSTTYQPYQRPTGLGRFPSVMRFIRPLLDLASFMTPLVRG